MTRLEYPNRQIAYSSASCCVRLRESFRRLILKMVCVPCRAMSFVCGLVMSYVIIMVSPVFADVENHQAETMHAKEVIAAENITVENKGIDIRGFSINWDPQETDLKRLNHSLLLDQWLAEFQFKLSVEQMHMLAARLTRELRALGYQFHSVILPAQKIVNGILSLNVVAGRIGVIDIRKNKR
mgnify:CR=1 FL=1